MSERQEMEAQLRDAASLSLHWLRHDKDAVVTMIAALNPQGKSDMIFALLTLGNIAGAMMVGDKAYGQVLGEICAVQARAAAGLDI